MEIIDGYTHCGIRKYEPIERLSRTMESAGVRRAVLVQHLGEFDNSYIGQIVAGDRERFAGVALVDHKSPRSIDAIEQLRMSDRFRGVRFTAETLIESPRLWHTAVELGLIVVLYAPGGVGHLLPQLEEFLAAHPRARVVLSHMGNPDPADGPAFEQYIRVFELSRHPEIYYQVSGMKMFCLYPHEALRPLIALAMKHFGPSRMYWGSNYPVVGGEADYSNDLRLWLDASLTAQKEATPQIVGGTALNLWFPNSA